MSIAPRPADGKTLKGLGGAHAPDKPASGDDAPTARPTIDDITRWLSKSHPADHAIEIRAPETRIPGGTATVNVVRRFAPGEFRKAATEAYKLSGKAPAVYVVMNGIDPALPRTGRLKGGASAEDVPRRLRLLIDCDPKRPGTCSATDDEKAAAFSVGNTIRADLRARRFPEPMVGGSGNGDHSIYGIDLPNTPESTALVKGALEALAARYDSAEVHVDTVVFDPPRLVKLYGTLSAKGENTSERPHRYSRVLSAPAELLPVPVELLQALADEAPKKAPALDLDAEVERKRSESVPAESNGHATPRRPDAEARAAKYLAKCEPAVSGQGGHDKAFKAACKVGPGFDLSEEAALRLLKDQFNPRCDPEWTEKELRHKVAEAYKVETRRGWLLNAERNGTAHGTNGAIAPGTNGQTDGPPTTTKEAPPSRDLVFSNFSNWEKPLEDGKSQTIRVPLRMDSIAEALQAITGGWPKRIGPMLFVEGADGKPHWLDSSPKLFAYIDRRAQVVWTKGASFVTQERFYEDQKVHAERYDAIEVAPHFPPMPRTYYMHPAVGKPAGKLEGLLDMLSPATRIDRSLIKTMILTPFWGGLPGRRPAYLVTGPDRDSENGRGVGKSTLVEIVAQEFGGGMVEVPPTGDMEAVKTRLLSPGAAYTRFARLDNVKALRFSWAELEGVITSATISGKRLYQGEGTRPNTLVWAITVNGESLSEDLAQRCIHVRVKRPIYRASWESEVRQYIRDNLHGLWGDVRHALENASPDIEATGRWADWEAGVLAATDGFEATQTELADRRKDMNADRRESDDFLCYVTDRLVKLGHNPESCYVFIPSLLIGEWLDTSERKKHATNQASARIRGFGILELSKADTRDRRGWVWKGLEHNGKGEAQVIPMPI